MAESGTELDFLDDLTPMSQALIQTAVTPPPASAFTCRESHCYQWQHLFQKI